LERINQVLPFIAAKEWLVGLFTLYVLIAKREAKQLIMQHKYHTHEILLHVFTYTV